MPFEIGGLTTVRKYLIKHHEDYIKSTINKEVQTLIDRNLKQYHYIQEQQFQQQNKNYPDKNSHWIK